MFSRSCRWWLDTGWLMGKMKPRLRGQQQQRGADRAHGDTLELLQKLKTVRQFSMEEQETEAYDSANARRSVVSERLDFANQLAKVFEEKVFVCSHVLRGVPYGLGRAAAPLGRRGGGHAQLHPRPLGGKCQLEPQQRTVELD